MAEARKPRIVTLCVSGRDKKSRVDEKEHLALLEAMVEELEKNPQWAPVDAVVLPGGFLFEDNTVAEAIMKGAPEALQHSVLEKVAQLAKRLDKWSPGVQIITGVDTSDYQAHGQKMGGHQLSFAFNRQGVSGYARKTFLVGEDYDGKLAPPMMTREKDFDDEHRIISLANGSKALLCVCYDIFGIGDAARNKPQRLSHTVKIEDREGRLHTGRDIRPVLRRSFDAFRALLEKEQPDTAITVIHRFRHSGAESFYQRHGIATASAGLGGGFSIAAAHIENLPDNPEKMCLMSSGVGQAHLEMAGHREPHCGSAKEYRFLPSGRGDKKAAGLMRLYTP